MEILKYKELEYVVRRPANFDPNRAYPLLFYIHGAGGRGTDIEKIRNHSFFIETEPFCADVISVAPQCYANTWFDIFEQLQDFIAHIIATEAVDPGRVYLMGASMGGYTTWQLAMTHPDWFAAIIPICGGGMYWNAERLKYMGIWAFHGSADKTVLCEESEKMVNAVNKRGGNAKLTIYEGVPHNSWTPTFRDPAVWEWLFAQTLHTGETSNEYNNVKQFG